MHIFWKKSERCLDLTSSCYSFTSIMHVFLLLFNVHYFSIAKKEQVRRQPFFALSSFHLSEKNQVQKSTHVPVCLTYSMSSLLVAFPSFSHHFCTCMYEGSQTWNFFWGGRGMYLLLFIFSCFSYAILFLILLFSLFTHLAKFSHPLSEYVRFYNLKNVNKRTRSGK